MCIVLYFGVCDTNFVFPGSGEVFAWGKADEGCLGLGYTQGLSHIPLPFGVASAVVCLFVV